ncbi:MAG: cyclopropane-fatty-acyl-phospholipid synthase family protein [Fuerstiella sp.]
MSMLALLTKQEPVAETQTSDDAFQDRISCAQQRSGLDGVLQRAVVKCLSALRGGRLYLDDQCRRFVLGQETAGELHTTVTVNHPRFYRRLLTGGSLGAAEAYLDKDWDCDDLPALFRLFSRNLDWNRSVRRSTAFVTAAAARAGHWLARNTKAGSRRNIGAHYDLGNDFFELFLDPSMMYSAAIYQQPDMSLEQAQTARLDHICRQLNLQPSDHVMEIGTGWGGFAIHAARYFGCRVTTTTISERQYQYAANRVSEAGLNDRITLLQQDYRDLQGQYDKLVSLEMVEAVGRQYHDRYFATCGRLLKPGGRMLLQAIVMPEQRYDHYLRSVDFIQKYIFPGGCLPTVSAMQAAVAANTSLRLLNLEDFADGYARTLREWRRRFHERLQDVLALGYSERFVRMWDYYLAYCEGAFDERAVGVVQAVWGR